MQKPTEKPLKYQTLLATLCGGDYPMVNTNQLATLCGGDYPMVNTNHVGYTVWWGLPHG